MALVTVTLTVSPYDRVPEPDQRSVYATLLYGPVHDSINDYDILGRKRRVGYVDQTTGVATFTLERNSDTDDPDSVWRVQVGGANYLRRWTSSTPSTVDLGDDTWEVGQTPPNGVDYQLRSERGQPNGYPPLDSGGLVPTANLPSGGGGGGGAPTGAAGGDLSGTYPNPTVPGLTTRPTKTYVDTADASNATAITNETTARTAGDATLTTAVAGKAAATDLTAEVSRATGVEAVKADLVSGLVPTAQIPPIALTQPFPVADQTAMLALTAQPGDFAIRADNTKSYVLAASPASTLSNWLELTSTGQVASVNTQTGAVVLGAADVGAASASALTSEVTRATNAEGLLLPASDPSVTNARTPTAHATTHASAGSDAVTLAESQVTGLVTDLAGKLSSTDASVTNARTPTAHAATHGAAGSDPVTVTEAQVTGLAADLAAKLAATDASVTNARTPTGTAGGDLTGTFPNPTLATARALATRLISAGTGLTGGGDLTADRTLTVAYGTTAGTALQGNDASVTNARTPTAHASTHASGGSDPTTLAESQITNLGTDLAKRTVWRGAWTASTAYAVNDLVSYSGGTYLAPTAFTSATTFTVGSWTTLAAPSTSGPTPFVFARAVGTRYGSGSQARAGTGHNVTSAGRLLLLPVWLYAGAVSELSVYCGLAAVSTWRLGLYPVSPTTSLPDGQTRLLDAGTVSTNATGLLGVSTSYTVPANGWYWSAVLCDAYTATPAVSFVSGDSTANGGAPDDAFGVPVVNGLPLPARFASMVTVGAIPTTCPTTAGNAVAPRVMFLAA